MPNISFSKYQEFKHHRTRESYLIYNVVYGNVIGTEINILNMGFYPETKFLFKDSVNRNWEPYSLWSHRETSNVKFVLNFPCSGVFKPVVLYYPKYEKGKQTPLYGRVLEDFETCFLRL